MSASDVLLRGEHNIENVLASMAITSTYSVSSATLAEVIGEFQGVEHRIEFVASVRGVAFFNDSKATNVDSAIKAVASFERNVILILGWKRQRGVLQPACGCHAREGEARCPDRGSLRQDRFGRRREVSDKPCYLARGSREGERIPRTPGRRCSAVAGLRQFRHVRKLRTSRTRVQESRSGAAAVMPKTLKPDHALFLTTLALVGLGVAMVFSASTVIAQEKIRRCELLLAQAIDGRRSRHGDPVCDHESRLPRLPATRIRVLRPVSCRRTMRLRVLPACDEKHAPLDTAPRDFVSAFGDGQTGAGGVSRVLPREAQRED